jgi:translocation and assembly module TamB
MRRALKVAMWVAGSLTLLVVVLGGALYIVANSDSGRALIERATLSITSGHVALSGLNGSLPSHLTLARLELRDDRGVWLSAERVTLDWSPLALLARRVRVDAVHAARVDMERLPESSSNARHSGPVSIPRIDVAHGTIDVLRLGAPLAGVPASLELHGAAHLRSLQDMVIDAAAHRIDGDGDYALQLRFDPQRMDLALNLHEPAGGPLENLLQLPGLGALAATVNMSGPRAAERLELAIDAGALQGRAQGRFNLTDLSADLDFSLDSQAQAPRPDLAWESAAVHGRWHGSIKAPQAEAHVKISQLRLPGDTRLAALDADFKAADGAAAVQGVIQGLRIPGLRPQLLEDSPLTIAATMRLDDAARPLDLSASHRLFSLHALAKTAAPERTAKLELRIPSLGELAALGGPTARGSALINAELREDGAAMRFKVDASSALTVGKEIWSGVVGDRATLQLAGALTDQAWNIEALKISGQAVSMTATGGVSRHGPATLQSRWSLNVSNLSLLSAALAGTLEASGTANGSVGALAVDAQLASTLALRDSPAGRVSAAVKLRGLPSNPSGSLSAQGSFDGAAVDIDVALERAAANSVRALVRRAQWKSVHAEGDITFATTGTQAQSHGQLRLGVDDLADLHDLFGTAIGGSLSANVLLQPDHGGHGAQLHIDARNLKVGQFAGQAQLSANGAIDAMAIELDVQAPDLGGAAASLAASGTLNLDARTVAVTRAVAKYRGQEAHLLAPAKFALANGVAVDSLKLGAHEAVLDIAGKISPGLDLQVVLHKLEPSLINVFAPGLLEAGTIEASAQLQGSSASPTGRIQVDATGLALSDDAALGLPALDLHATARLEGDTADIEARLVAGHASQLSVAGRAPLNAQGALDLKIGGSLDVGMFNPLLEARGQRAAGELSVDATVTGSVASPQIEGAVNLTKGSINDYGRGFGLNDITATVVGSAGTLRIKSMTAAAAPGTVSVTGTIGVLQAGIPVDLHLKAEKAQPLVSKLVTSNLDADLQVSGTARRRLDVVGTVHLNRTLIGIPNSLPPEVAVLDVRRRGKAAPPPREKRLVVGLDVTVTAPQQILVQGRGLDAEMGGDLHLGGTAADPAVSGSFDLLRGNFSLSGNKLNFSSDSKITFNGAGLKNKIDPTLDFKAQTTVGSTTVTLAITGLADAPKFELTSNPPLGQDEIMALLLFGTSVQQLSALQVAQIGLTLATLTGAGGNSGINPLARLQKSLGLDRLTVGSGTTNTPTGPESAGASIAAGRYISKRIYIEAKQTTQGTSQLETDIDLTRHLKLQTRFGNGTAAVQGTTPENDPGSSVGLIYQIEY